MSLFVLMGHTLYVMDPNKTLQAWLDGKLERKTGHPYLRRRRSQCHPIQAGQNVDDHGRIDFNVILHQLGVLGMEGVGVGRALARLDRAGQKVEAKHFHFDAGVSARFPFFSFLSETYI
jgi:hypothetical protein